MLILMPVELTLRFFTVHEAGEWLATRGHSMPGGQRIEYKLFVNYFPMLRRRGLQPLRFGRSWVIPESELVKLEQLWRDITAS